MRDGSVIRFRNWSLVPDKFLTLGFPLLRRGWKTWRHGRGVQYLYHSHRKSPSPSQTDQAFMKILHSRWPHVHHLIFTPDRDYEIWRVS